ncbi:MAG: hypothetical protein V5A44_04505 [Haloarculaceae archaeon]
MSETRLTPEIDVDGVSPEEAFAVLGDETRLEIVRVLWEAGALHEFDDLDDTTATIPFSELRRRVGVDDNGKFNYHLSKLQPHFVRGTDDGYRLSGAGKKIARTVVAVAGEADPDVAHEVDTPCPLCGATVTAAYEDQWLRFSCTECDGLFGDAAPEGTLLNFPFPPAGVSEVERAPEETMTTGLYRCMLDLTYMMQGVCRECTGHVRGSVSVCDDHDAGGGPCETCGSPFEAWGELRCRTCGFGKRLPVELCILGLAPVIGFLYEQEFDVLAPSLSEVVDLLRTQVDTAVFDDPRHVAATVEADDDRVTLVLDDELGVVDVTR